MEWNFEAQQWEYFTGHHIRPWHGLWERIKPDGTVFAKFKCLRHFSFEGDTDHVTHRNTYTYDEPNGERKEQKEWNIARSECLTSDGIVHPVVFPGLKTKPWFKVFPSGNMLGSGIFWGDQVPWAIEGFFIHPKFRNIRIGIVAAYTNETLNYFARMREDSAGLPGAYWQLDGHTSGLLETDDISFKGRPLSEWKLSSRQIMDKRMEVCEKISTDIDPIKTKIDGNQKFFHLNDDTGFYLPLHIIKGNKIIAAAFACFGNKLFCMCLYMDEEGQFDHLEQLVYVQN